MQRPDAAIGRLTRSLSALRDVAQKQADLDKDDKANMLNNNADDLQALLQWAFHLEAQNAKRK